MFILQINHNHTYEWFEINNHFEIHSCTHLSDLSECPKINSGAELVVLIPGENITLTSIKLPRMRASEKTQATLFALEEQLASDLDNVSVVLGDVKADGSTSVAVYDKRVFESQLTALHAVNLFPRVIMPDFLAVTFKADTWAVVLQNKTALVRTDVQAGFSVDANNLFLILQLALEKNKNKKPKKIICWQQDAVIDISQLEKLGIPIEMHDESKQTYFETKQLTLKPAINFLQGKYRPKPQSSALRKNWMIAGAAGLALIAFLFVSQLATWVYYRHQSTVLENQVMQAYQNLFPGSKEVLEPHFRTAHLLKQFENASRASLFLKMMDAVGKSVLSFSNIQITAIHFDQQQLTVSVAAKNVALLSQWSQALHAEGFVISQHVLSAGKGVAQAEMIVRENKSKKAENSLKF